MVLFDIRVDDLPDGQHLSCNIVEPNLFRMRDIGDKPRVWMLKGHGTEAPLQCYGELAQFRLYLWRKLQHRMVSLFSIYDLAESPGAGFGRIR